VPPAFAGPPDARLVWGLAAAILIGALVGIEREKSKAQSGNVGIGGVRTFILFSLTGAVAAWLSQTLGSPWVFVAAVSGVSALAVAGYVVQARAKPGAVGLTTEAAAIGMCLLGAACIVGSVEVTLALGVAVSAFLAYKQPLHALVGKLGTDDIEAGVKLLVASFIVLPLLPREAIDPWGAIRPHSLWLLVILIAALSLVGYVATRALGPERGTAAAGLAGGLVSSTAVTLSFARRSREEGGATDDALAGGLLIAWGVMFVRVVILAAFVHAPLVPALVPPFAAMGVVTLGTAALLLGRTRAEERAVGREVALRNPFSLTSAVKFGLLFAVVLLFVRIVQQRFPGEGYYVVAALAGLTDVDAITLSMVGLARDGGTDPATATNALVAACLSNTLVKCGLVLALASPAFKRRAAVATVLLVAVGLGATLLL
jgi:uncharacterized membrane protein (DUF4010 family)